LDSATPKHSTDLEIDAPVYAEGLQPLGTRFREAFGNEKSVANSPDPEEGDEAD
jgi:hypothetical protein